MQNKFRIALIQSKVLNDPAEIRVKVESMIRESYSLYKPDIIVLAEFWIGKYSPKEIFNLAEYEKASKTISLLSSLSKELSVYIVGGSCAELVHLTDPHFLDKKEEDMANLRVYNTCYCFDRSGEIAAKYRKCHLFDVDIKGKITFKESDKFGFGEGFSVFKTEFGNIGLGICYDIRFPEFTKTLKEKYGCNVIIFPSNFSTHTGKMHWDILMKIRAVDNNCFFIKCCPSRNYEEPKSYQSYGYSQVCDPTGKFLVSCTYEESINCADIDLEVVSHREKEINLKDNRRNDLYELVSYQ